MLLNDLQSYNYYTKNIPFLFIPLIPFLIAAFTIPGVDTGQAQ
jgi:hypothetical protein